MWRGDDFGDGRLPAGDGAGFVEQDSCQRACPLKGFAVAEEDAGFRAASGCRP